MTQTDLEKIFYLKKELRMWQRRLADLQADIALGNKQLNGMPRSATNAVNKPTEDKAIKIEEVTRIIEGKISEIQYAISEVDEYILSIEDPLIRLLLRCRCCELMSWDEVAIELGGNHTAESVRQMYHRFVKDMSQ